MTLYESHQLSGACDLDIVQIVDQVSGFKSGLLGVLSGNILDIYACDGCAVLHRSVGICKIYDNDTGLRSSLNISVLDKRFGYFGNLVSGDGEAEALNIGAG